jgi:hypothetical protein
MSSCLGTKAGVELRHDARPRAAASSMTTLMNDT